MAKNSDANNYLTVRVSIELRTEFVRFCKSNGLSPSQAIAMFVQYYIRTKDPTCCFVSDDVQTVDADKSENLAIWLGSNEKAQFSELAKPNMSILVRGYMRHCVAHGIPQKILSFEAICSETRGVLYTQVDRLQDVQKFLAGGNIDDTTAATLANELSGVCDQIGSVIDKINI